VLRFLLDETFAAAYWFGGNGVGISLSFSLI
jgi:hypothetical protein